MLSRLSSSSIGLYFSFISVILAVLQPEDIKIAGEYESSSNLRFTNPIPTAEANGV